MDRFSSLFVLLLSFLAVSAVVDNSPWSVTDKNGNVCVLAAFNGTLTVSYNAINTTNNETYVRSTSVVIPMNASVDPDQSFCTAGVTEPVQRVSLMWKGDKMTAPFNLSLTFVPSGDDSMVDNVQFQYDLRDSLFVDAAPTNESLQTVAYQGLSFLIITKDSYLTCRSGSVVNLNNENSSTILTVVDLKLQAFRMSNSTTFNGTNEVCPADNPTVTPTFPTTTQEMTTTAAPPSTTEAPSSGLWWVKDSATVCVLATFNASFVVSYNATRPNTNETYLRSATVNLPADAMVVEGNSFCQGGVTKSSERLTLQWGVAKFNLSLNFVRNADNNETLVDSIQFQYDLSDNTTFLEATPTNNSLRTAKTTGGSVAQMDIHDGSFLKCQSGIGAILQTPNAEQNLTTSALLTNLKLQAYRMSNSTNFEGNAEVCSGDDTPTTSRPFTSTPMPVALPQYNVTKNGVVCLMAVFDLSVKVVYDQKNTMNMTMDATADINTVNSGQVNRDLSYCNENVALLVIDDFVPEWRLELHFANASSKFSLDQVTLNFNLATAKEVMNATKTGNMTIGNMNGFQKWQAAIGHSYKCQAKDDWSLNVTNVEGVKEMHLLLDQIQVQPFVTGNSTSPQFGQVEDCYTKTSDVVPIAVGCALAALVVIVLIAYVIGRRRNRARGYESM